MVVGFYKYFNEAYGIFVLIKQILPEYSYFVHLFLLKTCLLVYFGLNFPSYPVDLSYIGQSFPSYPVDLSYIGQNFPSYPVDLSYPAMWAKPNRRAILVWTLYWLQGGQLWFIHWPNSEHIDYHTLHFVIVIPCIFPCVWSPHSGHVIHTQLVPSFFHPGSFCLPSLCLDPVETVSPTVSPGRS